MSRGNTGESEKTRKNFLKTLKIKVDKKAVKWYNDYVVKRTNKTKKWRVILYDNNNNYFNGISSKGFRN